MYRALCAQNVLLVSPILGKQCLRRNVSQCSLEWEAGNYQDHQADTAPDKRKPSGHAEVASLVDSTEPEKWKRKRGLVSAGGQLSSF